MKDQAELIGARPAARRAIGSQMRRPRLDVVLRLAASAVDILIGRCGRTAF